MEDPKASTVAEDTHAEGVTAEQPTVSHECPKGVDPGHMFVKDGKTFCCESCPRVEHQDNTCEFC